MDDVALVIGKPLLNTAEFPSRARARTRGQGPSSTATNARSTRLARVFVSGGVLFMLSDAADFLCGSVVFVDGGSDAYFRADDWPRPVPAYRLLSYLKRFRG